MENLYSGAIFKETAGINSRRGTLVKKASNKEVYLWLYKNFQRF